MSQGSLRKDSPIRQSAGKRDEKIIRKYNAFEHIVVLSLISSSRQ
jgi:hypothetical protein